MKIGIHGREFHGQSALFVERVLRAFSDLGAELFVTSKFVKYLGSARFKPFHFQIIEAGSNLSKLKLFVSLGGDGTLLESVMYIGKYQTPILGINTGRMGFLATISREEAAGAIKHFMAGKYTIDSRILLKLETNPTLFGGINYALNDCTIMKKDSASMITVHVYVNNELLNSYWADGVVISTPTGSTGYSLSCGGPIVYPESQSFIITPVSPHTLTARPVILPDSSIITFKIEGRKKKFLVSLDSRFESVDESITLKIKKEKFQAQLVQLPGQHYFKTLRQKLNWGLDVRNWRPHEK